MQATIATDVDLRVQCPHCRSIYIKMVKPSGEPRMGLGSCKDCGQKWHYIMPYEESERLECKLVIDGILRDRDHADREADRRAKEVFSA